MSDWQAAVDQAVEDAKQTARPIVAFHRSLVDASMPEKLANELTFMYAKKILGMEGK